jgi:hypothetical protein
MKDIALPVLPHDTPLRTAVAVMHASQRSAVVTTIDETFWLIRAGDVFKAASSTLGKTIGELRGVQISTDAAATCVTRSGGLEWRVTEDTAPMGVPMAPFRSSDWGRFSSVFNATNHDYALDRLGVGTATVITRSEDFETDLNTGPLDCYCEGPRQHGYREPHPLICPRDQQPVNCWS